MATTPGTAVPGTNVPASSLVSTGGSQGIQGLAGAQGTPGPTAVSGDAGNIAMLGSDHLLLVPQQSINQSIWSVRLRSFNAIGNPNFEVDQRNAGSSVANVGNGQFDVDRWAKRGVGAYSVTMSQMPSGPALVVPGTNFRISSKFLQISLITQETTMAAGDSLSVSSYIEGPVLRELINDVHSVSLLVSSTVAPLTFSVALRDSADAYSLVKLCTISTANTWTLISLPNLPIWTASGSFPITPGSVGYDLNICLASGSTYIAPATNVWQNGNFVGASGMSNFCASPVNSAFYIGFVQHEPGSQCTQLIDKPFAQNLSECSRYYWKSQAYANLPNAATGDGPYMFVPAAAGGTWALGDFAFPVPMAKTPTFASYANDGSSNAVTQFNGSNLGLTGMYGGPKYIRSVSWSGVTIAIGTGIQFHYTADTGW